MLKGTGVSGVGFLDKFTAVTGFHRKHAMRLLRTGQVSRRSGPRLGRRVYDDAVREALIVVWEASDRICGKRLRPLLPILIEAMEQHGHLQDPLSDNLVETSGSFRASRIRRGMRADQRS